MSKLELLARGKSQTLDRFMDEARGHVLVGDEDYVRQPLLGGAEGLFPSSVRGAITNVISETRGLREVFIQFVRRLEGVEGPVTLVQGFTQVAGENDMSGDTNIPFLATRAGLKAWARDLRRELDAAQDEKVRAFLWNALKEINTATAQLSSFEGPK